MSRVVLVAAAFSLAAAVGQAQGAVAPLRWASAPASGQRIVIDAAKPFSFAIKAVAAGSKQRITLSLLGANPLVRLSSHAGNPAVGVVRYVPKPNSASSAFTVTFVAHSAGSGLAITRTVVLVLRQGVVSLVGPGARYRWAYVLESTVARSGPTPSARALLPLSTATSDGRPNLVLAVSEQKNVQGKTWVRVRLTALPNGRTGWVPKTALSEFRTVSTVLVVDTNRLALTLSKGGKVVFRAPIGVGRRASPTPRGFFYIRERVTGFHNPFYGPIAFGTNARSEVLTDWPGGGIVGIHGTNAPSLIPGRISHGCVRLRNSDILTLARILPLGTPVIVR